MIQIAKNKALERWDALPMILREALYSEENSDFLWKTCEAQNIPKEKIYDVARLSGYVLMGFLNPEDMVKELQETTGVDKTIASMIKEALNKKIFTPLQQQIDQVYSPISASNATPKIIQEIKVPITPQAAPKPPAGPQIISQTYTATPNLGSSPLASNRNMAAPAPAPKPTTPPPSSNNGAGWSRRAPQEPTVKLGVINPQAPAPMPPKIPVTAPTTAPSMPRPMTSAIPSAPPRPQQNYPVPTPPKPQGPAPMIIHEQSALPTQNMSNFQLKTPPHDQMATTIPKPSAPQAARFEFNAPPKPPTPPKPQGNVIVKDFL